MSARYITLAKQIFLAVVLIVIGYFVLNYDILFTDRLVKEFGDAYAAEITPSGQIKEFTLTAKESQIELLDGYKTTVWSYNGSVPGPELRVQKGDTVRVRFQNNLPQETTIHWHGVRVPNAMDGVSGVTQDSVQPGDSFLYEFTPKDAGTFWFHPHVRTSEQIERGLYGLLIVEDPDDPIYSQDIAMVVDDWRLLEDGVVDPRFNTGHDLVHDGRWGSVVTVNSSRDYGIRARPGERLRLRFVNTSNGRVYKLDFGELEGVAIAVDGMKVGRAFSANGFELAPGNRLDVDVTIPQASISKPFEITDTFTRQPNILAAITVSGDSVDELIFDPPVADHVPEWKDASLEVPDKEYILNARRGGKYGVEWTINGKAFPTMEPITLKTGEFSKLRF